MVLRIFRLEAESLANVLWNRVVAAGYAAHVHENSQSSVVVDCIEDDYSPLADLIADILLSEWLRDYAALRVAFLHPYLSEEEQHYVALLACHSLRRHESAIGGKSFGQWEIELSLAVRDILEQEEFLDLDGVIRFRARGLLSAVDEAVNDMVEQFLADREYEEFVSMLRYMLESQATSPSTLHVYCANDRVWICDENGELLRDNEVSRAALAVSDGAEVNSEDLAMSILITQAPCQIVVHDLTDSAPWPSFSETLERVFLERAIRCTDCSVCRKLSQNDSPL